MTRNEDEVKSGGVEQQLHVEVNLDEPESESDSNEVEDVNLQKVEEQRQIWKIGGWDIDPDQGHPYGPRIHLESSSTKNKIDYFLHFFPLSHLRDVMVPATNTFARQRCKGWVDVTEVEMIKMLGMFKAMEVYKLPERRMYWMSMDNSIFPSMNFVNIMSRSRFEDIFKYLRYSDNDDENGQIIDFLNVVNEKLTKVFTPGKYVTLDESMIKSFHRNLKGKIKRKPRPVGNEIKDVADAATNIVTRMELYEGKDDMREKDHVKQFGATCATTLRLTEPIQGTGRIVIADSWFGSVKAAIQLRNRGLFSTMVVKTAHKNFPVDLLNTHSLKRGEWIAYTAVIDGVKLMVTSFMDIKKKQFISTCSTAIPGKPRITRHGEVSRPQVAEKYLSHAAAIDIHNHVRTGSLGCEDVVLTHSPHMRQFTGIIGFLFTNSYLAYCKYKPGNENLSHVQFKIAFATSMCRYTDQMSGLRSSFLNDNEAGMIESTHKLVKLGFPARCYFCSHGYEMPRKNSTTFKCGMCDKPICKASSNRECWNLHVLMGKMPPKRYFNKTK